MDMLDLHGTNYGGAAMSLGVCEMLVLDEADRSELPPDPRAALPSASQGTSPLL